MIFAVLWAILGRSGSLPTSPRPTSTTKRQHAKNLVKHIGFCQFWPSRAPPSASLRVLVRLRVPLEATLNLRTLSAAALKVSWAHLARSGRFFGPVLSRLGRAQGVPGGPFGAPKLTVACPFWPSVCLFRFVHRCLPCRVPFWTVFGASRGPPGAIFGPFPRLFGPSEAVLDPSHKLRVPKMVGRRCLPRQGRSIK